MGSEIPSAILTALLSGQTVLTANQHAARALRRAFDESQQAAGAALWIPPGIFALDTWLPNLFHQLLLDGVESRMLLNRVQEHSVWRGIVAADPSVSGLRSVDTLAEMAAEAWQLLHLYDGRARLREFAISTDTRAFQRWAEAFDRTCTRNAYLTSAQLPVTLADALAEGNLPVPDAGLLLVDFDTLAPAHSGLFDSIRGAGFAVDRISTTVAVESASLLTAQEDSSEIRMAALWTQRRLDDNPSASIAIVVPNLDRRRGQLDRVFHEIVGDRGYEFSLGRSLAETALVATALDLLRWPLEPRPLESVSALLLSPFLAAPTTDDALARAEFDAFELRTATILSPELSLDATIDILRGSKRSQQLAALIKTLYAVRRAASDEQFAPGANAPARSHAAWADAFRSLLETAGWTAASNVGSHTFQTRRRFESALDELATLDFDGTRVTASAALKTLTRIARQTLFAPESRNAPVQIVGPLEPGGVPFDALWFLGADDTSWPPPTSSQPLIPWHIQRDLGIPGADPVRDTLIAQTLTDRLARSAPLAVFSFALHSPDGDRRPSPLLRALNLTDSSFPFIAPLSLAMSGFEDTEPLPPLPATPTHGGARILELQAACSFRAFAELRLSSTQPEARDPGLDPRERGNHVHDIMREFYARVPSQDALRALPRAERDSILDQSIELALAQAAAYVRAPWDRAYLEVQRRRLRSLLRPWLDSELSRPPFTVRQREEELKAAPIGPLVLNLRADRIDDTAGGTLIIDYKTGAAATSEWLSDRPDKPQLPLYAVLAESATKLGGIAFALLRPGKELALTGFADSTRVLPKPARTELSLTDQLQDWHRVLTDLAVAFAKGDPVADPKSYPATCKFCAQRILCRLDLAAVDPRDEDEDETYGEASDG